MRYRDRRLRRRMCAGSVPGGPLGRRNCTPASTWAASTKSRVIAKRTADADDQPAAALPPIQVKSAASATAYDVRWAIQESCFSPCRSWTRFPSQEAMARRQTATWMTQMTSMSAAETSAPTAQPSPGPAPANLGNTATAAVPAMTATTPHAVPICVSRSCGAMRAAMAGCAVAPYAATCLDRPSSWLMLAA